jgi:hypothetical protein
MEASSVESGMHEQAVPMSRARSGPAAVDAETRLFFERERRRLFRALYLMTGSVGEAEELTQDAFPLSPRGATSGKGGRLMAFDSSCSGRCAPRWTVSAGHGEWVHTPVLEGDLVVATVGTPGFDSPGRAATMGSERSTPALDPPSGSAAMRAAGRLRAERSLLPARVGRRHPR